VSRFRWSLNNYELWRYDLDGAETLIAPIEPAPLPHTGRVSSLGAVVAPDGRHLYFSRRTGDVDAGDWSVVRREIASGKETTVLPDPPGPGRAAQHQKYFRPMLSPDGERLVYAARYNGQTGLRLRELASGADRWLAFPIERDQIDAQSWQDLIPRFDFTPEGDALILSRNGKLERMPLAPGPAQPIPFTASVELELGPQTRVDLRQDVGAVRARLIQTPEQSPDGKRLAYSALGHIYVSPLDADKAPRRLTSAETPEFQPSWAPDGRSLTYVTWSARDGGHVWIAPADGGAPRRISDAAAFYTRPVFTPDGQALLALRSSQRGRLQTTMDLGDIRDAELVEWRVADGAARVVHAGKLGGKPHFSASAGVVYLHGPAGLISAELASGASKTIAQIKGPGWYFMDGPALVDDSRMSPDGRWLLVLIAQQLHLLAAPASDKPVDLSAPGLAHRRITNVGADFFEWADGGRTITWAVGSTFHRRALSDIDLNRAQAPNWSADIPSERDTERFEMVVETPRDTPQGALLLTGARVLTMRGDEALDDADVLIRNDRIAAVGPRGSLAPPPDVVIRDVAGKTIAPGYIDIHDHIADIRRGVLSTESWGLRARLAYGVTTAFDPSSLSIDMFAYQDLIDAGVVTGSRLATTGMAMFSFNRLASLDDARALLTRYRDHYRTRNAKQYLIGNRRQRQWLAQAAKELGVMPTTEGSLALKLDLSQIMDGYAGSEHALPTALYRDVIELVARSGAAYDATLQIDNGGPASQDQFIIRDRPLIDEKFLRTRPYTVAAATVLEREWFDPSVMVYPRIGLDAAKIQRAGGVVGMGSHGEIPGPGLHWEMEAHVQGGMTPLEALRAATIGSATAIGRAKEFGSIEPGKFADLVILDADPRLDIRHARKLSYVMKNGRLYDASTLDELWPRARKLEAPWFGNDRPIAR
jgi:predicted amidohydrolase